MSGAQTSGRSETLKPTLLLRVRFDVFHREILQRLAGKSKISGLSHRSIRVPLVDDSSLDEPHRRCSVSARAMNKCGLGAWCCDGLQELVDSRGIRLNSIERHVEVVNFCRLRCRRFSLDVRAGFTRLPQVDDGCISHLLDIGYCSRRNRAGTCDSALQLREIGDARYGLFLDLGLSCGDGYANRNDYQNRNECSHIELQS